MLRKRGSRLSSGGGGTTPSRPASSQLYQPPLRTLRLESPMATPSSVNELGEFDFQLTDLNTIQQTSEPLFHDTYLSSGAETPPLHNRPASFALSSFAYKSSFSRPLPMSKAVQPTFHQFVEPLFEDIPDFDYDEPIEEVYIATAVSLISHIQPKVIDVPFRRPRKGSSTSSLSTIETAHSQPSYMVSGTVTPASSISEYSNFSPSSPFRDMTRPSFDMARPSFEDVDFRPFKRSVKPRSAGNSLDRIDERQKMDVPLDSHVFQQEPYAESSYAKSSYAESTYTESPMLYLPDMPTLRHSRKKSIANVWRRR